jgi:1-deoxy-D-xylulose-5-phosphate reductoisomerase
VGARIDHIVLTASGGPFRRRDPATLSAVTPEEACAHPNWVMGRKISVDSATMMNKALEVIEARWLFDLEPERVRVVLHPQSIVHSMVVCATPRCWPSWARPTCGAHRLRLSFPSASSRAPRAGLHRTGGADLRGADLLRFPGPAAGL